MPKARQGSTDRPQTTKPRKTPSEPAYSVLPRSNPTNNSITNPRGDTDSAESSADEIEPMLDTSKIPTMPEGHFNLEDLGRVLVEHNNHLMKQWADQVASLSQTFQQNHVLNAQTYNGVKFPTFSAKTNEDVVEFLTNFERVADFHKWEESHEKDRIFVSSPGWKREHIVQYHTLVERSYF